LSTAPKYTADIPLHIAIIMDGNGRWAQARRRPRVFGHQAGVKTVRRIVALFQLLKKYVEDDLETLNSNNVKVRIIGSRLGLRPDLLDVIKKVETTTQDNDEFFLNIAFNYGGRDDILRAVQSMVSSGIAADAITETLLSQHLDTFDIPDPDLVIRTSGEQRISNFLLWQAAYAEFVFTDVLWPDFSREDLELAIKEFQRRDRRFGNLSDTAEVA